LALVDLSVVEQWYRAVLAVHTWVRRYRDDGLAGLTERSDGPTLGRYAGGPVTFRAGRARRRNMALAGRQIWLGPARGGT
jgi:hypothetical protein